MYQEMSGWLMLIILFVGALSFFISSLKSVFKVIEDEKLE
tara:strand:+ start:469 stop:588 length:120 start_codon:yes stop_codon:yes gene_type:complete